MVWRLAASRDFGSGELGLGIMAFSEVRSWIVAVLFVFVSCFVFASSFAFSSSEAGGALPPSAASGTLQGTVLDVSGAVIEGATVSVQNPVSGFKASVTTGSHGEYSLKGVPFNNYHVKITAPGFAAKEQDVDVRAAVPVMVNVTLAVATSQTTVNVEASSEDVVENNPMAHTDLDATLLAKLPVESNSSAVSSVIAQTTPGVSNDSNGLFHPQGEHSDTSFSVDNQPITDQQSRVFSNQISLNTVSSMEVISGVAPAEFGDKASLVIRTSTKSGLGTSGVHGDVTTSYGSFGTSDASAGLSFGTPKFGNYLAVDGINSGRFLDSPEFDPLHAHGNAENFFDRIDYQPTPRDTFHLNVSGARSWFQTPNEFDQQANGQDQRQMQRSFNIAPGYSHQFGLSTLLTANAFVRQDRVGYYPSDDPFADTPATLDSQRRLTNVGAKVDVAYVKGAHNIKGGFLFQHTFLSEYFATGITDPSFNVPGLLPFDLTRGGQLFVFRGRTDIKQEAAYVQDNIKYKSLSFSLGLRGDNYNGISSASALEPRVGVSYQSQKTGTVLRASYGRFFLTPYNENLVLSSSAGSGGLATAAGAEGQHPLTPGRRNHFETGFQQAIKKYVVLDASYFWKYTDGDYDFDVILNTPLTFPIQWRKSKIDGFAIRVNVPETHGVSAYSVMGHTRARFFGPEIGGILFNSPVETSAFRIDHDQVFESTTHVQYSLGKRLPWVALSWQYESGQVAGRVPDLATMLTLSGDQQAQAGLFCGTTFATPTSPISSCSSPNFGATRLRIPPAGTWNADGNPSRIAPRNLFDASVGIDNLLRDDKRQVSLQLTAVNLTNKVALYNFLSTFSGTHFMSPRSFTVQLGYHF